MPRALPSFLLTSLPALLLSACAGQPSGPAGRLTLHEPVTIPAASASLRLQHGRITAFNAVQEQDPFCVFELHTVAERPQRVAPGVFDILTVSRSVETFSGMPAFLPGFRPMHAVFGRDDGPSQVYYKTAFRLGENPQRARALTCMSNQLMPGVAIMRHLTPAEMRDALGSRFTLELDGSR